jgi:hypothetical protein
MRAIKILFEQIIAIEALLLKILAIDEIDDGMFI